MSKILIETTIIESCAVDCNYCYMLKNSCYCEHPNFDFMEKSIKHPYKEIPDFCPLEDYSE